VYFLSICSFSQAKKCSNEGRALMQLDYQQFLSKLGNLTYLRPIPDHDFVEVYIKAYYLTENDMEKWIQEHRVCDNFFFCFMHTSLMDYFNYWEAIQPSVYTR